MHAFLFQFLNSKSSFSSDKSELFFLLMFDRPFPTRWKSVRVSFVCLCLSVCFSSLSIHIATKHNLKQQKVSIYLIARKFHGNIFISLHLHLHGVFGFFFLNIYTQESSYFISSKNSEFIHATRVDIKWKFVSILSTDQNVIINN